MSRSFLGYSDAPETSSVRVKYPQKAPNRGFAERVRQHRDQLETFDAHEMAARVNLTDAQTRSAIEALIKAGEIVREPVQLRRYRWVKR